MPWKWRVFPAAGSTPARGASGSPTRNAPWPKAKAESFLLADALVVVHFGVVVFIVGGLLLVWIGAPLGWRWIRNPWFRYLHLGAIGFVAAEAVLGVACPLTVWEDMLRGGAQAESFVGRWVRKLLFYRAPEWVFAAAYLAWALATLATLRLVPPRRKAA